MFPQFPCPLSFFNNQPASGQSSKKNKKTSGRENVSQPTTNGNDNAGCLEGLFNRRINKGNKGKNRAPNDAIDVSSYVPDFLRLDPSASIGTDPFKPPLRERRFNASVNAPPGNSSAVPTPKSLNAGSLTGKKSFASSSRARPHSVASTVSVNVGDGTPPRSSSDVPTQKSLNAGPSIIIEDPFKSPARGRPNSGPSGSNSSANVGDVPPLRRLSDVSTQNRGATKNSTTQEKYSLFLKKMKSDTRNFVEGASRNFSSIKHNLSENGSNLKIGLDNLRRQAGNHLASIKEKTKQAVAQNGRDLKNSLDNFKKQATEHLSSIKGKTEQAVSESARDLKRSLKDLRRQVIYAGGNSYLTTQFKKPSALDREMKKALDEWKKEKKLKNKHEKDSDLINLRVATLVDRIYKNRVRKHGYIDIERVRQSMLEGRKYDASKIKEEHSKIDELFSDEKFQSILKAYMPGKYLKKDNSYISPEQQNFENLMSKSIANPPSNVKNIRRHSEPSLGSKYPVEEIEALPVLDVSGPYMNSEVPVVSTEQIAFYSDVPENSVKI